MRRTLTCILALLGLFLTPPARAEIDPRLAAAIERWLDDDDAGALPVMAELARAGDADARLLLGVMRHDRYLWPYAPDPELRHQLFLQLRPPAEHGAGSWLKVLEPGNRVAWALLQIGGSDKDPDSALEAVRVLMDAGEPRAAAAVVLSDSSGSIDPGALIRLAHDGPFPERARHRAWVAAFHHQDDPMAKEMLAETLDAFRGLDMRGQQFLVEIYPLFQELPEDVVRLRMNAMVVTGGHIFRRPGDRPNDPLAEKYLRLWLATAPEALPLRLLCDRVCPDDVDQCLAHAYNLHGGYPRLIERRPPNERLIPSERFDRSRKLQQGILRSVRSGYGQRVDLDRGIPGRDVPEIRPPSCLVGEAPIHAGPKRN